MDQRTVQEADALWPPDMDTYSFKTRYVCNHVSTESQADDKLQSLFDDGMWGGYYIKNQLEPVLDGTAFEVVFTRDSDDDAKEAIGYLLKGDDFDRTLREMFMHDVRTHMGRTEATVEIVSGPHFEKIKTNSVDVPLGPTTIPLQWYVHAKISPAKMSYYWCEKTSKWQSAMIRATAYNSLRDAFAAADKHPGRVEIILREI